MLLRPRVLRVYRCSQNLYYLHGTGWYPLRTPFERKWWWGNARLWSVFEIQPAHATLFRVPILLGQGCKVPARTPIPETSSWSKDSLLNCHGEPTSHAHHSERPARSHRKLLPACFQGVFLAQARIRKESKQNTGTCARSMGAPRHPHVISSSLSDLS